jgi:hypothetical protein
MENQVTKTESKFDFPTETIELPSKGLLYPEDNILSKGTIEMRYMTAAHEDILTNRAYIDKGTVVEKLLQALIVTPINFGDLIIGDQDAIMIAARVLGYGKNWSFRYGGEDVNVDVEYIYSHHLHFLLECYPNIYILTPSKQINFVLNRSV